MKKIMVSLVTLVFTLLFCGTARAQAHANRYGGGSTSHSGNTTTRTNAYGGSATHTAGQGTTASNAYGGSASHAEGSGKTTATNAYGGSATHTAGQGTSASNAYGGSAYHAAGSGTTTATNAAHRRLTLRVWNPKRSMKRRAAQAPSRRARCLSASALPAPCNWRPAANARATSRRRSPP